MKKSYLLIAAMAFSAMAFAPADGVVGKKFPLMACEDYNGKQVNLPDIAKGKYTLIGMAFSNDAEKDLKLWIEPLYNAFVPSKKQKEENNPFDISSINYDVNLYFVPMFTKANQLVSKNAKEKIKSQSNPELYPYLLFYEGGKTYKEELNFENKDIPYFFVIDKTGKITYATSGEYNEKKLDAITDALSEE
jgi:hypothetical protein